MWRSIVTKCADTPAYVTERLCVAAADVAEADGVLPLVVRLGSSAGFRAFCAEACASLRLPLLVFRPCAAAGFAEENAAEAHVADFPLEQPVVMSTPVPSAVAAKKPAEVSGTNQPHATEQAATTTAATKTLAELVAGKPDREDPPLQVVLPRPFQRAVEKHVAADAVFCAPHPGFLLGEVAVCAWRVAPVATAQNLFLLSSPSRRRILACATRVVLVRGALVAWVVASRPQPGVTSPMATKILVEDAVARTIKCTTENEDAPTAKTIHAQILCGAEKARKLAGRQNVRNLDFLTLTEGDVAALESEGVDLARLPLTAITAVQNPWYVDFPRAVSREACAKWAATTGQKYGIPLWVTMFGRVVFFAEFSADRAAIERIVASATAAGAFPKVLPPTPEQREARRKARAEEERARARSHRSEIVVMSATAVLTEAGAKALNRAIEKVARETSTDFEKDVKWVGAFPTKIVLACTLQVAQAMEDVVFDLGGGVAVEVERLVRNAPGGTPPSIASANGAARV